MAERRMGILSEQQAEAGRKSRFLQQAQLAPDLATGKDLSQQTVLQEVKDRGSLSSPSNVMLAKSANDS